MLEQLLLILVIGLISGGIAILFRALPWPKRLIEHRHWFWKKLWHCVACAGLRNTPFAVWLWLPQFELEWSNWRYVLSMYLGASILASAFYSLVFPPPEVPIELPE